MSRLFPGLLASTLTACMGTIAALGQTPALDVSARVSAHPDLAARTRLSGHVPAWVATAQDLGNVSPSLQLDHVTVTLTRPAALEAAFQQLLKDQQDASSPRYHQWLTPKQSAELYGVPQADSDAVAAWLQSQGLHVDSVSPTRQFITFSGAASSVASAFSVQLHSFNHMGRTVFSTTSEPAVPTALASVILGVTGLSEEYLKPAHTVMPTQTRQTASNSMAPDVNLSGGTHWILPADFAVIYDVNPVYNAGINGSGQHVAIIGASRVLAADISGFESLAGLSSAQPNSLLTPGSSDPGMTSDSAQGEATLDVDRVIGTAPGATADLVLISSLLNTQILSSLSYIVNTLNDPIINMSFGSCEATSNQSTFNSFNTLFAQAAGQGISIFVSSGDSESAGCMTAGGPYTANLAVASTNVLCTPYVTCVGGTQFADTTSPSTYWSSTNGAGNNLSALSYIPEGVWNEPSSTTNNVTTYVVEGGGGGASTYAAKPTWQVGTGVPADSARDTPDVSFSASGHNAYLACLTYSGAVCPNYVTGFGGTSASAPSMAGIMALVNQKTAVRQGLFNAKLYQLALTTSNGVFHDATPATSGVTSCSLTVASTCNTSTPGTSGLTGGLSGAALTTGYDLATGLGSIDVSKLINAVASPLPATTTNLVATPTTINTNQTATFKATISSTYTVFTPTGTVTFSSNGNSLGPVTLVNGVATLPAQAYPTAGTYAILATYSGDGNFAASAATLSFVVTAAPANTPTITLAGSTGTIPPTQSVTYTATLASSAGTPTGTVTFYNGTNVLAAAVAVVAGKAAFGPTTLIPGFYSVTAVYSGDTSFNGVTSTAVPLIVTGVPTSIIAIPAAAYYATTNSSIALQSNLDLYSSTGVTAGTPTVGPTGTITYNVDGVNGPAIPIVGSLSNGVSSIYTATSAVYVFQAAVHHVTATYSGDAIWAPSTSAISTLTVGASLTTTTVALVTPGTVTSGKTTPITVTVSGLGSAIPATGQVTLSDYLTGGGTTILGTFPFTTLGAASGTLSYTLPSLVTGTHQIEAVFNSTNSDINYQSSNGSLYLVVAQGAGQSFTVSSSPTTLTVAAGATTGNAYTATYTSVGGFTGTVSPSPCTVTANFSAATVMPYCNASYLVATVNATTPGTNIFTLTTTKRSALTSPGLAWNRTGAFGGVALSGLLLLLLPRRRRRWSALIPILLLAAGLLSATGCGGASSGSGGGGTTVNGTTAGSYTVTFGGTTGTGGTAITVTTSVTLNVQ
ncbi:Ig-like domain repeat protein [Granulicella rosea]|uniref:Ig-like domain repeat protein n=1 Tax=Granulicella rosea TaxID=474952 RepID=UPI00159595C8|nr:Ig-like domain repeat protein [Granulicella rosea]